MFNNMTKIQNQFESANDSSQKSTYAYESGLEKVFSYNGSNITFRTKDGIVYVNATEMAKPFNKQPYEYLRLTSTNELIRSITGFSRISENQLVIRKPGSPENGGGTWLHEDIALDFAQWLSVDFKIWCNAHIKELLLTGKTEIARDDVKSKTTSADYMEALSIGIKCLKDSLRLSDASLASYYNKGVVRIGLPEVDYIPSKGVKFSATFLLNKFGRSESIHEFNRKMEENGFLETRTRPSSKGVKRFKSLTEKGLEFGENMISPKNEKETQPHYYEDKFEALMAILFL